MNTKAALLLVFFFYKKKKNQEKPGSRIMQQRKRIPKLQVYSKLQHHLKSSLVHSLIYLYSLGH